MGETRQEVEFSRTCAFCDGGPTQPPCVECSGAGFLAVAALVPEGSLTAARLRLADAAVRCHKAEIASVACYTVFGSEEECAAFYAKVGYTEAEATEVEREARAAHSEYTAALAAVVAFDVAALRTKRAGG